MRHIDPGTARSFTFTINIATENKTRDEVKTEIVKALETMELPGNFTVSVPVDPYGPGR